MQLKKQCSPPLSPENKTFLFNQHMFLKADLSIVQGRSTKNNMQLFSKTEIDELSNFRQQMGKKGSERQRERKTSGLRPCLIPQTCLTWRTLFNIASHYHMLFPLNYCILTIDPTFWNPERTLQKGFNFLIHSANLKTQQIIIFTLHFYTANKIRVLMSMPSSTCHFVL